ncbi:hypothetical protein [Streptomyces sp. NPDC059819]|uniref:hypothetical protein n=1 Tax=Streptomyces sp. NPDC059819 TaxID=3346963 RepID=UPI00364A3F5E
MNSAQNSELPDTRLHEWLQSATGAWVEQALGKGERASGAVRLHGGATSEMLRINVDGPTGQRALALRSFMEPRFAR